MPLESWSKYYIAFKDGGNFVKYFVSSTNIIFPLFVIFSFLIFSKIYLKINRHMPFVLGK